MIFISAQPDEVYFIWQLEIQLRNFQSLGIKKNKIHVVVGYNSEVGLKNDFNIFINNNLHLAEFFLYPDTRIHDNYLSSIRPHLLKKHWEKFPFLKSSCVFYHDSDILLSRIPNIDINRDIINYVSDTRSYLDSNYIISKSNISLLNKMVELVGINVDKVLINDNHVGGAQYILKNVASEFWSKVESDSENIFDLLNDYNINEKQKVINNSNYLPKEINAWYADMWALLWNLWYHNRKVEIHEEMNFSWPTSPIEYWTKNSILHYAGDHEDKSKYFYKRDYVNHVPWYDDELGSIPNTNCSYPIVQFIKKRKQELDGQRLKLEYIRFFFKENTSQKYFDKYFVEATNYYEIEISDNIIIPCNLVKYINNQFKNGDYKNLIFTKIYKVDQIFTKVFTKVLNSEILELNKGKFSLKNNSIIYKIKNIEGEKILTITDEIYLLQ
ncbi:hypothetical protein [Chryseobacterium sp.]|uniref:hypothetical protein n=1 Tax=Chryseobacterium sp. TaxID=1871047 RepID=UPI00289A2686|nr:hypothetical protein [Chryseobacterium sp.]